ncbi:UNVERIFIED_CONTAM: protein IWS11 [Sesamum calycinum]|uniref:Protein IWS11 n=1 Tax=Sesamum calycinum TaxID=2727403 RepID=A0AAW2QXB8_9LAMI
MGDESDDYRNEDSEPLMDVDEEIQSDLDEPQQRLLDNRHDCLHDSHEQSLDPVYIDSKGKLQKRLIIKSPRRDMAKLQKRLVVKSPPKDSSPVDFGFDGDDSRDDDMAEWIRHYYSDDSDGAKRKREEWEKKITEKRRKEEKVKKKFKTRRSGGWKMGDHEMDAEMKEMGTQSRVETPSLFSVKMMNLWKFGEAMWLGFNLCLYDDREGFRTVDDDNCIYDSDVDPDDSYGSDDEHSPIYSPEDDINVDPDDSYGSGSEHSPIYTSEDDQEGFRTLDDDNFMDDTDADPDDSDADPDDSDVGLDDSDVDPDDSDVDPDDSDVDPDDSYGSGNEHSPIYATQAEEGEEDEAIKELFHMGKDKKKNEKSAAETALLVENVMAELKEATSSRVSGSWRFDSSEELLEPLPDGNLPDINIRTAVLKFLNDFPIDLQHSDRRGLLKRSGLGKVIMFLSMSTEETTANQKLAKELVDKWMNKKLQQLKAPKLQATKLGVRIVA